MLLILRVIMWPFSQLLNLLFTLTGSYGWSIVLFAVVIKLLMLYPSAKSKRNTLHMARMAPKMQEIKKSCGNDKEKYALEVQKLYADENVNPMGGCLWSFLPIPILIALYGIIRRPVLNFMLINLPRAEALEKVETLKQALVTLGYEFPQNARNYEEIRIAQGIGEHFDQMQALVPQVFPIDFHFLNYIDLTAIPWNSALRFFQGEITPSTTILLLLPILSGLLSFALSMITMRSNPSMDETMRSQQSMMMLMMPFMSAYIGFILPASLGIYWIVMSLFSIVQEVILQAYYNKKLDAEEAARDEAARQDRLRRIEEAKNKPVPVPGKNMNREKLKRRKQASKSKKSGTNEAGRVGDRPYARGRAFGHYEELDDADYDEVKESDEYEEVEDTVTTDEEQES